MSKRKRPTILGPDGQPLDRTKYETKPEPTATVSIDEGNPIGDVTGFTLRFSDGGLVNPYRQLLRSISTDGTVTRKPKALAERVAADVDALTADLDFTGRPELPRPTPDLTAYADALDVAVRSCPHTNVEDTIHSRGEYQCQDCGRYLSRDDMRRRAAANPFGGWFFR